MNERANFLAAMRRQAGGHVPKQINLCPSQMERFQAEYGHADVQTQWRLPMRAVDLPFVARCEDFSPWHDPLSPRTHIDEWGIGTETVEGSLHFTRLVHPLAGVTSVADIERYPFPDVPEAAVVEEVAVRVAALQAEGYPVMIYTAPAGGTIFWPAYKLRGMEALLCDMLADPLLTEALLERVTDIVTRHAALAARTGADVLGLADDLGTQISTYISPEMFRRWLKPPLARVIAAAKRVNPALLVHFHSDGAIQTLIPDLIEIGIDILNPIQPECMDPIAIKREYGRDLSFSGGIGTQTTIPFGTPTEVRSTVSRYCEALGKDGGYWVGPTHLVEPEVPWANVLAFVEAAEAYA